MTATAALRKAVEPPQKGRVGRPRAVNINPVAVRDLARQRAMHLNDLAAAAGISEGHFYDALLRQKGLSLAAVSRLATVLRCELGTIAPELTTWFVCRRPGDTT